MDISYNILGLDEEGNTVLDLDIPVEEAARIVLGLIEKGSVKITSAGEDIVEEEEEEKIEKPAPKKKKKSIKNLGSGTNGRSKSQLRSQVEEMTRKGLGPQQIAAQLGIPAANVYYYQKGVNKKQTIADAPEAPGSRDIDKTKRLSESDFLEIKSQRAESITWDVIGFSYPDYEKSEIKRAMEFENYQEYSDSEGD